MRCDMRRLAAVLAGTALFGGCKLKTDASSASQVLTIPDGTPLDQSAGYGEWGYAKEYAFEFNVLGNAQGASSLGLDDTKPLLQQGDMVIDEDQMLGLRGGLF